MAGGDLYFRFPKILTKVLIVLKDPGVKNHLEFLETGLSNVPFDIERLSFDNHWRGVFGYVSFGYYDSFAPFYRLLEPQFVNHEESLFVVPKLEDPVNLLRIWMRKGVKSRVYFFSAQAEDNTEIKLVLPTH